MAAKKKAQEQANEQPGQIDQADQVDQVDPVEQADQLDQAGPVDQADQVDQASQVDQALDTPANGPAPTPDLGNGSDGTGNPKPGEGASGSWLGSVAADEDLQKRPYLVTGLIDVRHDGELYTKGETLWLYQFSATPLLNKLYITPKEGQQ
jgi:hypothetical protein